MRRAVVAGTYDPITLGHLDVITRSANIFDEIIVAVGRSEKNNTLFSLEERVALVKEAVSGVSNVTVEPLEGLLVDFAESRGAHAVVKGLRAVTDFEYEFQMAALNYKLHPDMETFFIMSPPDYMYLSSSIVREIASMGGDVSDFVPPFAERALKERYGLA